MRGLSVVLVMASLLAGCSEPPAATATTETGPALVTDPADLVAGNASSAHLHDYWGGQERLLLLEATQPSPVGFGGGPVPVSRFRPEPGDVVPQGTAQVEITMAWTTQPDDHMRGFNVAVKSAGSPDFVDLGPIENGGTLSLATDHPDNDLPHQTVSNWLFDVIVQPGATGIVHYWGEVTLLVEVVRGLEIPLYPGHPDRWEGRQEIALLDTTLVPGFYFGDPESTLYGCGSQDDCFRPLRPDDGAVVPSDAAAVVVDLAWNNDAVFDVGLRWHAADAIAFTRGDASESGPGSARYVFPVAGAMGDGPYAKQSLWEFLPDVAGPVADGIYTGEVAVKATAYRAMPAA